MGKEEEHPAPYVIRRSGGHSSIRSIESPPLPPLPPAPTDARAGVVSFLFFFFGETNLDLFTQTAKSSEQRE